MEPSCVRQTSIPGTSKLYADYLYHFERVSAYFPGHFSNFEGLVKAARSLQFPESRRAHVVAALRADNEGSQALEKLAEPGTVVIVTGQQVGLLSGPVYTVFKALTAVKLAQELSKRGVPAVPVFWLATEDHDLAEIDHAFVYNHNAASTRIAVQSPSLQNVPTGNVAIEDFPLEALEQALGELPYSSDVLRLIEAHYGTENGEPRTYGAAFYGLIKELFKDFDLIYLDPLKPAIRELAAPFLSETAGRVGELTEALRQRNKELEGAGYHAQVHVDTSTSLLFLLENGRRTPLKYRDGEFSAKDRKYSASELAAHGEQISPNALLRPVMQDFLLPTVSYVAGPAETAYFAQSEVLYRRLLGRMPVIYPRNSFTLLDSRADKLLRRYSMSVEDVLHAPEQVRSTVANKMVPVDLRSDLIAMGSQLNSSLGEMREKLLKFDGTLAASLDRSMTKIRYQVEKISAKTARETLRRDGHAVADTDYLMNFIYPQRHLQERYYSVIPMLAEFGLELPNRIFEFIQLSCPDHVVRQL